MKARVKSNLNKAYKFRIYPAKKQEELLAKTFGCCRFILKEDKTPTSIGGELRQICLGGGPISFQDKASGGLQRCADVSCHARHDAHLAASTPRRT